LCVSKGLLASGKKTVFYFSQVRFFQRQGWFPLETPIKDVICSVLRHRLPVKLPAIPKHSRARSHDACHSRECLKYLSECDAGYEVLTLRKSCLIFPS